MSMGLANSAKYFVIFLLLGFLLLGPTQHASAAISFGSQTNLSNNAGISTAVQLAASGNNVYTVWKDDTEIFFANSTDNGVTFDPDGPFNISNSAGSSSAPDVSANGTSVYVVWDDGTDILFIASNDNGNSFGNTITLSGTPATGASFPQIASSGSNVYAIWKDDNEIFFANSTDNGATFDPNGPFQLSLATGSEFSPKIFASGNNVYVTWHNTIGDDEIFFRASTDGGVSFGNELNLSNNVGNSRIAQLSGSGNNVYVVWQDGNEIFFANSTDNGSSFDPTGPFNLSSNIGSSSKADISSAGSNVYVTWQDNTLGNNEVLFRKSSDNSASFSSTVNLSSNSGSSTNPKISSKGSQVYTVWQDATPPGTNDILFKSSDDSGTTFGGVTNLSNNGGSSTNSQVIHSGTNVYASWQDNTLGPNDILFLAGVPTQINIVFNASQYKLSDTATVNVTDTTSNIDPGAIENINVNVNSTSDVAGISLSLTETGINTGNFTGQLTFTTGPSAGTTLQTSPGETINANFGGQQGTATMFPRTIVFNFANYNLGSIANVIVNDQHVNLNPLVNETISVLITSGADPVGIPLQLNETAPDSGQFGNVFNHNLIFMPDDYLFSVTDSVTVSQADTNDNSTAGIDTSSVRITSTIDPLGIILSLAETNGTSALFEGILIFSASPSVNGTSIQVTAGDFLTLTHKTVFITKGMIIPNSDPTNGAIKVINPAPDVVTAAYLGLLANTNVATGDAPGGGGGGIVRPGLVLNAAAGIGTLFGGGGGGTAKPTISSTSLTLDTGLSVTQLGENLLSGTQSSTTSLDDSSQPQLVTINKQMDLEFEMYENKGHDRIKHISFYLLEAGERINVKESTYILYDKFDGVKINDPKGILSYGDIDLFKKDATNSFVKISFTLSKAVGNLNLVVKAWDIERHSNEWTFDNAINVLESSDMIPNPIDDEIITPQENNDLSSDLLQQEMLETNLIEEKSIPAWVKTTAKWWTLEQVSDTDFLLGVEYLIQENIIQVSTTETSTTSNSQYVPSWFRYTAEWWNEGNVSDGEFIQGLEWLIENGVMSV